MAAFGSNIPSEVGLRLLLCPLGSNIVLRTASCSVGVVLPVYSTFKALESRDQNEQQRWLLYWAAYGSFSIAEVFTDKFLSWFPLYYHMKLAFLVWLQLPSVDGAKKLYMNHLRPFLLRHQARLDQIVGFFYSEMGAKKLYMNHLRPFLLRHQARLDQIVGFFYSEMTKFVSANQGGLQFAKTLLIKILGSAQVVGGVFRPLQGKPNGATRSIGGPTGREEQASSEIEGITTPQGLNSESEHDE